MVPEAELNANPDAARRYLTEITRGWDDLGEPVRLELRNLMPGRVPNVARFEHDAAGMEELVAHAVAMNATGMNSYVIVNPVRASAPMRRNDKLSGAQDEDIVAAFFFWADGDDEDAANSIRNFAGPKHTMTVMTGMIPSPRPHIYWRCEDGPIRDLETWTGVQMSIAARLSTDPTVVNPSRIMRLPGTINWPTEKKAAKGRVPELTTFRTQYEDVRHPVALEQMKRIFPPIHADPKSSDNFGFDVGYSPSMDRETARIKALSGEQWNTEVFRLVGSYVRKNLNDREIHSITDTMTLPGYTLAETRAEVQNMINRTRNNPKFTDDDPKKAFDFDAGATDPGAKTWQIQSAAAFTADFVSPEFIIDGVIQRGRLYTLTAPTGSGKTAVMLYASTAMATGNTFCELEVEHGDVLFLAGENPDDVRARSIATMEFYGIDRDKCRIHFVAGTFSIRADMQRLKEEAAKIPNLMMVVVDTFAAYFDGDDENSNAQALDFARVVRSLTELPSKPAVIMPAHPVKNATRQNLAPKGGSSLVNEVDGNLTLWNDEGMLTLHWQVKFRGADFEPLKFELQKYQSDRLKDKKGRYVPTILAKPLLPSRALQISRDTLSKEDRLLISISDAPALSMADRCIAIDLRLADGTPHKSGLSRLLGRLSEQKLIRRFRSNWELTKDGERAVEMITSGQNFSPDLEV